MSAPDMQTLSTEQSSGADQSAAQIGTTAVDTTANGTSLENAASSGDVAAEERGPIPYDRFQQVVTERNQVREQLSQFTEVQDFLPLVRELRQAGYSPEQIAQYLQNPAPQQTQQPQASPDPQAAYSQWLQSNFGVGDPAELDPFTGGVLQRQFQMEQRWDQIQQAQEQQTLQGVEQQLTAEMQQLTQRFPSLANEAFQDAVYSQWGAAAEAAMAAGRPLPTLASVAERFHGAVDGLIKGELARYATGKQQDAAVPVATGGSAPPPAPTRNYHEATPEERRTMVQEHLAAVTRTP